MRDSRLTAAIVTAAPRAGAQKDAGTFTPRGLPEGRALRRTYSFLAVPPQLRSSGGLVARAWVVAARAGFTAARARFGTARARSATVTSAPRSITAYSARAIDGAASSAREM